MTRGDDDAECAGRLASAIRMALDVPATAPPGFSGAFEDAAELFGDALHFEADPRLFASNLLFECGPPGARKRVCQFFTGWGDWEQISFDFRNEAIFREVGEVAAQGGWSRQLPSHRKFRVRMRDGRPVRRNNVALDTVAKIDAYFENTASLLASIAAKGVVRRPAFTIEMAAAFAASEIRPVAAEIVERDVGAGIGPRGELLRVCPGLHRTAAALHLGVASMPVELRMIHIAFLRQHGAAEDPLAAVRRVLAHARRAYAAASRPGADPFLQQQSRPYQETPP